MRRRRACLEAADDLDKLQLDLRDFGEDETDAIFRYISGSSEAPEATKRSASEPCGLPRSGAAPRRPLPSPPTSPAVGRRRASMAATCRATFDAVAIVGATCTKAAAEPVAPPSACPTPQPPRAPRGVGEGRPAPRAGAAGVLKNLAGAASRSLLRRRQEGQHSA